MENGASLKFSNKFYLRLIIDRNNLAATLLHVDVHPELIIRVDHGETLKEDIPSDRFTILR